MKLSWFALALAWPGLAATVEFNRDIRPILSDKCYTCHGPDKGNRKSVLRFDTEAGAKVDLGGHFAIVPGGASQSGAYRSSAHAGMNGAGGTASFSEILRTRAPIVLHALAASAPVASPSSVLMALHASRIAFSTAMLRWSSSPVAST